jgi:hypothetical protein
MAELSLGESLGWLRVDDRGKRLTYISTSRNTTYAVSFVGRRVGAIGIFQRYNITVKAPSWEEARMCLYEKYEHISELSITHA